ncbi:MAG: PQQ-binding-like beta-propeller repeat protein, partial [Chloroflexota bacterium]
MLKNAKFLLLLLIVPLLISVGRVYGQDEGLLWSLATDGRVDAISMTADGQRVAIGARDNLLRVLDNTGELLWQFEADNSILGVDMTPDGAWIAVASEDRFVYLLDGDGEVQWQYKAGRPVNHTAIADDGSLIAATSNDLSAYALDGEGNLLWQEVLGIGVQAVSVYGKGEKARVVVGSDDGLVTIYSRTGKRLLPIQMDYDVMAVDVTPNGARIVVGTSDGSVTLLNGGNGDIIWTYKTEDTTNAVAIARDGTTVLAGSEDDTVYLLNKEGELLQTFAQESEVLSVALSGDGMMLAAGTVTDQGRIFDRDAAAVAVAQNQTRGRLTLLSILAVVAILFAAGTWAVRTTAVGQRTWQTYSAQPRSLLQEIWRARYSYALIIPTLVLLLTFNYYPAFSGLYHAFTEWSPGTRAEWIGFANFRFLMEDRFFISGFRNAGILVVVSIIKTMTVPLLVAELIFNLRNRFSQYWMRTLFVVPIVLPSVVEILLWNNIYDPEIGLLNKTLELIGLEGLSRVWYGDPNVALSSIIFIGFPWVNAFALLIFYGGLISISDEVIDSSRVDGASTWRRFWSIDLPLVMGQIKLLLILNFIQAVQTFELVFLTTGGGPGAATYTPALELYYMAMRMDRMGVASAIGMVLFLIILAGTIINMRFV